MATGNQQKELNLTGNISFITLVNYLPEKVKTYFCLSAILLVTFLIYLPILNNGLVWDDLGYIKNNALLQNFDLKKIFSQNVLGNYHPLTILVLATEYKFFGLDLTGYHAVNLFFHLANTALVFYVIYLLVNNSAIALLSSFFFGIHPLHVESVAWAAELKDLLYTFFFLVSFIFYLKYIKQSRKIFLVISVILFLFSLLSKAQSASYPAVLLLTDFFLKRKMTIKTLLEKVPFFALAIIYGVIAIGAQQTAGATNMAIFPLADRVVFASYGYISYLVKLILPLNLKLFYPYPIENTAQEIPVFFKLCVFLIFGLMILIFYSLRFNRKVFFGFAFFTITVLLVLQLMPVGAAMMADRYSYVPSIGIFYIVSDWIYSQWNNKTKKVITVLFICFSAFYSIKTFARTKVWKNEITMWSDVIEKYPKVALAYSNRGVALLEKGDKKNAISDFNKAIEIKPNYSDAYYNRGIYFMNNDSTELAIKDFSKAIELFPKYSGAYINRGYVYQKNNRFEEALKDFNTLIDIDPDNALAYFNRGSLFKKQLKLNEAIKDLTKAVEINPTYTDVFYNRGLAYSDSKMYDEAIKDLNKVVELNPERTETYIFRGIAYRDLKRTEEALKDYRFAIAAYEKQIEESGNKTVPPNLAFLYSEINKLTGKNEYVATSKVANPAAPNDATIFLKLLTDGNEAYKKEQYAVAIENYKKCDAYFEAMGGHARYPEFLNAWARSHLNINEPTEAKVIFKRVVTADPKNYYALMNLGNIAFNNEKKYSEAIDYFSKCIDANSPDHFLSYKNLGTLYIIQNQPDKAIESYESALHYGSSPDIYGNLFLLWKSKGNQEKMAYYQGLIDKK